jgi:hypothetical protein
VLVVPVEVVPVVLVLLAPRAQQTAAAVVDVIPAAQGS